MTRTHLMVIPRSENRKLTDGRISVAATYRAVGPTCPKDCGFLGKGCYAQRGPVHFQQARARGRHDTLEAIAETDVKLVRHHVSGDLFRGDKLDIPYLESVIDFHRRNPSIQGWTYTHRWRDLHQAGYRPKKMPRNLAILASCDNVKQMREARRAGWPTARVAEERADRLPGEAVCRYQLDGTTCSRCKLCWEADPKVKGIMFLRH